MAQLEADLSQHSYAFAVPCYEGNLKVECALSVLDAVGQMVRAGISTSTIIIRGGALVHNVRNELTHRFLHETDCDTMICIDSDIEFTVPMLQRLLVYSTKYPIIAGAYPSRMDPPKFFVNHFPNPELNEDGLLRVNGTGMGFVAIQRKVFEQLEVPSYKCSGFGGALVKAYFQMEIDEETQESRGEDIFFFRLADKQGIPTYIDPGINLVHHGFKAYDAQLQHCIHKILNNN